MKYKHLIVKVPITEDKWVKSVETRSENPEVLHHALSFVTKNKKQKNVNALKGYFSGYVPGTSTQTYPDGMGKLLPKDSYLIIQLHYTPNGTPVEDQVSLHFKFYDEAPKHKLEVKSAYTTKINIPPHAENHVIVAEHKFNSSGYLTAFNLMLISVENHSNMNFLNPTVKSRLYSIFLIMISTGRLTINWPNLFMPLQVQS